MSEIDYFYTHRSDLYDITIQSEDGTEVCCHRCVLVARLEYFHSMLSSGWVEVGLTKINIPVPKKVKI